MQGDYTRKLQEEVSPWRQLGVDSPDSVKEALAIAEALQNPEFQRQLYDRLADQFGDADELDAVDDEFTDPRDKQLSELAQRLESFERRQVEAEVNATLAREQAEIKTAHPEWGDDEMQKVAMLAIANGGSLLKGAEVYASIAGEAVRKHIESKAVVTAGGAAAPRTTAHAEVPDKGFGDDLEAAHKAALAYFRAHAADQ
jgi:hypothetical protein